MRARLIVIRRIGGKNSQQVRFAEDNHLVQALATQCADQTFRNAILPRAYDFLDLPFEYARYRKIRLQMFSGLSGRILDAGVGTGRNFPFYPANSEVVGIDFRLDWVGTQATFDRRQRQARQHHQASVGGNPDAADEMRADEVID